MVRRLDRSAVAGQQTPPVAGPLEWIPFDEEDAREAGAIRTEMEHVSNAVRLSIALIAAQARRHGAIIATCSSTRFEHIADLQWEDWAAP